MKATFKCKKYSDIPGDTRLVLTTAWGEIPRGAIAQPLSAGWNNPNNRMERTVSWQGRQITGAY